MREWCETRLSALGCFLSPARFTRNLMTHFRVPFLICVCIWLFASLAWSPVFETATDDRQLLHHVLRGIAFGLVMALHFSTAASCIRRRFTLPLWGVIAAGCVGLVLGALTGSAYPTAERVLTLTSLLVCVVASCWTRNPLLSLIKVAVWFVLCFVTVFFLTFFFMGLGSGLATIISVIGGPLYLMGMAYLLAPWLFLGGLPFGDEDFLA